MRAIIVGFGSIGQRHAEVLRGIGCDVAAVSGRQVEGITQFGAIAEAIHAFRPGYAIVANRTSDHRSALVQLAEAGFDGICLVEKPIFAQSDEVPPNAFAGLLVAYNLRFHPAVQRLRRVLLAERVLSVHAYAGHYLPAWRPDRDYREVYSAHRDLGGGVLRDLSHELDYLNWILDGWSSATAIGGHLSSLKLMSEDIVAILASFRSCPAAMIQLNYLDRLGRRLVIVNTERHTLELNLVDCYLKIDDREERFEVLRNDTYRAMHEAVLNGQDQDICTAEEALEVMKLILAIENSMNTQAWAVQ